jgi:hypothetical protein
MESSTKADPDADAEYAGGADVSAPPTGSNGFQKVHSEGRQA